MKSLLFLIIFIILFGCSNDNKDSKPDRPDNVPNTAFWQGGKDGGDWYDCISTNNSFQFKCSIFNDYTGELLIDDEFELYITIADQQQLLSEFLENNKLSAKEVYSFNGYNEIYLNGNLSMKSSQHLYD